MHWNDFCMPSMAARGTSATWTYANSSWSSSKGHYRYRCYLRIISALKLSQIHDQSNGLTIFVAAVNIASRNAIFRLESCEFSQSVKFGKYEPLTFYGWSGKSVRFCESRDRTFDFTYRRIYAYFESQFIIECVKSFHKTQYEIFGNFRAITELQILQIFGWVNEHILNDLPYLILQIFSSSTSKRWKK